MSTARQCERCPDRVILILWEHMGFQRELHVQARLKGRRGVWHI